MVVATVVTTLVPQFRLAAAFAPLLLASATLFIPVIVLNRLRDARWLRYRDWRKSGSPYQSGMLTAAYWVYIGIVGAIIAVPMARLHLLPALPLWGSPLGLLLFGFMMAFGTAVFSALLVRRYHEEPQDWLTWGEGETDRR